MNLRPHEPENESQISFDANFSDEYQIITLLVEQSQLRVCVGKTRRCVRENIVFALGAISLVVASHALRLSSDRACLCSGVC